MCTDSAHTHTHTHTTDTDCFICNNCTVHVAMNSQSTNEIAALHSLATINNPQTSRHTMHRPDLVM